MRAVGGEPAEGGLVIWFTLSCITYQDLFWINYQLLNNNYVETEIERGNANGENICAERIRT